MPTTSPRWWSLISKHLTPLQTSIKIDQIGANIAISQPSIRAKGIDFFTFPIYILKNGLTKKNFLLSRLRCLQKISYISLELAFLKAFLFWKLPEFRPEWTSSFWWNEMFIPWMQIRNAPPGFQNSQIEIGTFLCVFSTHLLQLGIFAFFLQLPLGKPSKEKNGNILVFYQ